MVLLLQARRPGDDTLAHELDCFVRQSPFPRSAFRTINLAAESIDLADFDDCEMVMVGGAGDFSFSAPDFAWHDHFLDAMRYVVRQQIPTFASCFGCHALVKAFGGQLEKRAESGEVGTFDISLTDAGKSDDLFRQLPEEFPAQLGHQDSIVSLPDELISLASSERCAVQAVRIPGEPIYATQFHPELTAEDNIQRYATYIQNYEDDDPSRQEALSRAREIHRPSPDAARLLHLFVDRVEIEVS